MTDLGLAIAHHVLVFGLVGMLMAERALVSGGPINVPKLARLDAGVGGVSMLVLVVGVARVVWGGKGWAFYEANPFFWAKVATFGVIGLLSIGPTRSILRWRKARAADPMFAPDEVEMRKVRTAFGIMVLLVIPLVSFAAAMARFPF